MPFTLAALQIYEQYMADYDRVKSHTRYDIHGDKKLVSIYSDIQKKDRLAPVYMNSPSGKEILQAIRLKEDALTLRTTIATLGDDEQLLFAKKSVVSSNPDLVEVEYIEQAEANIPSATNLELSIKTFASPQVNQGNFLRTNSTPDLPQGSYSFDILAKKLHYELQFNIYENDTNEKLEKRIARLINTTDMGLNAEITNSENTSSEDSYCALRITSNAIGVPIGKPYHFKITDEKTSKQSGIVDYLGIDNTIKEPTNTVFSVNKKQKQTYANSFTLFDSYHIILHPEYQNTSDSLTAQIKLVPDKESIPSNIEDFVDAYNSFISDADRHLTDQMQRLLKEYKPNITKYGITTNDDATLSFTYSFDNDWQDTSALQSFGRNILKKIDRVTLDPMEYIAREICSYKDPDTPFVNPYTTSIYSGLMFNYYC